MRILLCTALLAASFAAPAHAGRLLDLAVVDRDTGATLRNWTDAGRLYVAGTPGHRYAVRLSNRSDARVLAVLSVDGVNAVSGETASPDQTGYVLDAGESTEIAGWRKSLDQIAQFTFTALPDSYAARTGRPGNVGVIGVAVFTERVQTWRRPGRIAREAAPGAPAYPKSAPPPSRADSAGASAARALESTASGMQVPAEERLGTGHGAREYARVDTTAFERASQRPVETLAIWYDSYASLVAQGIITRPLARRRPQPFPGGFVPDPD